ncbi:MAG: septal ring lytic transglycosylase RlpA family protein [Thiolinea sp.]
MMRKIQKQWIVIVGVLLTGLLAGCGVSGKKDKVVDGSVLQIPLQGVASSGSAGSRCGNERNYTLNGRSYQVLPSAQGYKQQGMATVYGAKYQGSTTAGCETFDMHKFTAAHRTLPLPAYVRVTNLGNNKSVIVKVNDRGPFENDGLIQLSFAAASTLGMGSGSARVRVETVGAGGAAMTRQSVKQRPATPHKAVNTSPQQLAAVKRAKRSGKSFFVVVKNYPNQTDALEMFVRLTSVGLKKTEMASAIHKGRKMHQVRVGPLYTQDQIDSVKDALASNGLATFRVVEIDQ